MDDSGRPHPPSPHSLSLSCQNKCLDSLCDHIPIRTLSPSHRVIALSPPHGVCITEVKSICFCGYKSLRKFDFCLLASDISVWEGLVDRLLVGHGTCFFNFLSFSLFRQGVPQVPRIYQEIRLSKGGVQIYSQGKQEANLLKQV